MNYSTPLVPLTDEWRTPLRAPKNQESYLPEHTAIQSSPPHLFRPHIDWTVHPHHMAVWAAISNPPHIP